MVQGQHAKFMILMHTAEQWAKLGNREEADRIYKFIGLL